MTRSAALNLALLALYPVAWGAPLARAGLFPFFSGNEISIFNGFLELLQVDVALALIVALFAMVAPYVKSLLLAGVQFGVLRADPTMGVVKLLGRLSMTDVFLIAVYIVVVKGVGIGHVETAWGLYLFTALVLVGLWLSYRERA